MIGKVKFYNAQKGYGIISTNNQGELFFMRKDIVKTHQHCCCKEKVSFTVANDNYGTRAINVKQVI